MFFFFCILTLGLVYEWIKSALLWESLPPRRDSPKYLVKRDAALWGLQIMILLCAISVVTLSNIVHSLISLIVTFVWCAILIINHQVSYLGLAFVTIYIGSISVLFIFVIMMLKDNIFTTKALSVQAQTNHLTLIALMLAPMIYVFGVLLQKYSIYAISFIWSDFCSVFFARFEYYDSISAIGMILYTSYSKHLIIASLVLLVGMVGSIVLVQFHPIPLRGGSSKTY
jgi:NADH-quinone oxidoreductase subunit J